MNTLNATMPTFLYRGKWLCLSVLIGVACGTASAFFLLLLEEATHFREGHPWLIYLLPIGGLMVGGLYYLYGRTIDRGSNLIIDEFHDPRVVVPFRMAPLVLAGTVITHLFGGSAGREGTAVQMGGSLADQLTHFFDLGREGRRTLLIAGMAGGFGSVFGVPFAGACFGVEVLAIGRLQLWGFVEAVVAAFIAHRVTLSFGVEHTQYTHPVVESALTIASALWAIVAGIIFGLAARLFVRLIDSIKTIARKLVPLLPVRAFLGGGLISILFYRFPFVARYGGLGVPLIVESLRNQVPPYDWLGKLTLTAMTLGMGFQGGEVTPLLFVGSTLGNALSGFIPIALPILSAMGFVAVFAGAANTPFTCTIMALELFGTDLFSYVVIACFASYAVSGHHGIYQSQKVYVTKSSHWRNLRDGIRALFARPPVKIGLWCDPFKCRPRTLSSGFKGWG